MTLFSKASSIGHLTNLFSHMHLLPSSQKISFHSSNDPRRYMKPFSHYFQGQHSEHAFHNNFHSCPKFPPIKYMKKQNHNSEDTTGNASQGIHQGTVTQSNTSRKIVAPIGFGLAVDVLTATTALFFSALYCYLKDDGEEEQLYF